jgi:ATP-binding cassette subfamily F protein 3
VSVIGRNGAGKSTFLKVLLGELASTAGTRTVGAGLTIGYFAQHQLEQLNPEETPLSYLAALDPSAQAQTLRDYVGGFGFGSAGLERPIRGLSGGEKSRLVLAGLAWSRPHLLLLDEPTNHLDLEMREALSFALQDYTGALVLVSHDRHLIRSCADTLWVVGGGRVQEYAGDLDDYQREAASARETKVIAKPKREARHSGVSSKTVVREQRLVEARMAADSARLGEIDAVLGDPRAYQQGGETIKALQMERAAITARQQIDEEEWLTLEGKLAEVQARLS